MLNFHSNRFIINVFAKKKLTLENGIILIDFYLRFKIPQLLPALHLYRYFHIAC